MDFELNEKVTQVLYIFIIGYEMISHYLLQAKTIYNIYERGKQNGDENVAIDFEVVAGTDNN